MRKLNYIIYYRIVMEKIEGKNGDFCQFWWGFGVCAQTNVLALYNSIYKEI